jgi:hypothetical protein
VNARLFDEGMVEAQVWFEDLMRQFGEMWMGNRMVREEEVQDGAIETEADLYDQEE